MKKTPLYISILIIFFIPLACTSTPKTERPAKVRPSTAKKAYSRSLILESIAENLQNLELDIALASFDLFNSQDREDAEIRFLEASVLVSAGRFSDAETLTRSLLDNPELKPEALHLLALIERSEGNREAYQETLEAILEEDPTHAQTLNELGYLAWEKRIYKRADNYWIEALKNEPANLGALIGRARINIRNDQPERAEAFLDRAIEAWPTRPEPFTERARLYRLYDLYKEALDDLNTALNLDPYNYWNLVDRARVLIDLGRKEEAIKDLERAQNIDSSNF